MQLIDYIDFHSIFERVKKNQLEMYPTAQDYIKELEYYEENFDYVEEMYKALTADLIPGDAEANNSQTSCDGDTIWLLENRLELVWTIGGNNATENGDDYWGYGWRFTIDLDNELFVGYSEENYG